MDLNKMLEELRAGRDAVSEAILALEAVARRGQRKQGRPPLWRTLLLSVASSATQPEETQDIRPRARKPVAKRGLSHRRAAGKTRGHG